jgi:hypothetical protein
MPARSKPRFSAQLATRLSKRLARNPLVRRGSMFGFPAFFVERRMFACICGDEVGVKLPEMRVRRILESKQARPFRPYGKPAMRQWLAIDARLAAGQRGAAMLREAIAFATQGVR